MPFGRSSDAKLEALRKSYEEACTKVKAQELKDLQRIYDAIVKGSPSGAATITTKIDVLAADVSVMMKAGSTAEQWLQGKWIIMFQGSGDVMEFKGVPFAQPPIGHISIYLNDKRYKGLRFASMGPAAAMGEPRPVCRIRCYRLRLHVPPGLRGTAWRMVYSWLI